MFKQKMQNGKIKYGEWYIDPLTDKRKRVFVTIKSTGRLSPLCHLMPKISDKKSSETA